MTSFIRWGISVAIICSKAQLSPWAPNMDLKLSIPKIKLSVVSPKPTILQISKKHHFYPIAQDKNLRVHLDSSLSVPRLSNPSTHLSTCILTSPTPTLRHPGVHGAPPLLQTPCAGVSGLDSAIWSPSTAFTFLKHESGHVPPALPGNLQRLVALLPVSRAAPTNYPVFPATTPDPPQL